MDQAKNMNKGLTTLATNALRDQLCASLLLPSVQQILLGCLSSVIQDYA